jgi:Tfp pilus assembly protein PilF
MRMKPLPVILKAFIFAVFFIASCKNTSPDNEIPITTTSKEALKFYIDGRSKFEDIEYITAASLFDKAIQADTNFARAYLYLSLSGGGPEIFRKKWIKP